MKILGMDVPIWLVVVVAAFFLLRNGAGGGVVDQVLDMLRKLFNRPDSTKDKYDLNDAHECCSCAMELAEHFEKHGHKEEADSLRAMLPKLAKGHNHA